MKSILEMDIFYNTVEENEHGTVYVHIQQEH